MHLKRVKKNSRVYTKIPQFDGAYTNEETNVFQLKKLEKLAIKVRHAKGEISFLNKKLQISIFNFF